MKFHTMEAVDNMVHSRGGGEDGDIVVDIRRDVEDADVVDNDDNVVVAAAAGGGGMNGAELEGTRGRVEDNAPWAAMPSREGGRLDYHVPHCRTYHRQRQPMLPLQHLFSCFHGRHNYCCRFFHTARCTCTAREAARRSLSSRGEREPIATLDRSRLEVEDNGGAEGGIFDPPCQVLPPPHDQGGDPCNAVGDGS